MIRTTKLYLILLLAVFGSLMAAAQDVMVNVTPVQEVLPPQAMLYIDNPGKYFNVSLTNLSAQQQDVYLSMQVEQVMPSTGLNIAVSAKYQPNKPISIPANGVRQLTMAELKTLFNHVPMSEVSATEGLIDSYNNGSFGLLPEGQYEARLVAYRWANPKLANPVVVSNPSSGHTRFTVCYKAQAPQFLMPAAQSLSLEENNIAKLDVLNPMFTWTIPTVACNPIAINYQYDFKVVELLKGQHPDEAIERNPIVYQATRLMAPQCILPRTVITSDMRTDRTYVALIKATAATGGTLNYVMIENEGKSNFRLFQLKTSDSDEDEQKTGKTDTDNGIEPIAPTPGLSDTDGNGNDKSSTNQSNTGKKDDDSSSDQSNTDGKKDSNSDQANTDQNNNDSSSDQSNTDKKDNDSSSDKSSTDKKDDKSDSEKDGEKTEETKEEDDDIQFKWGDDSLEGQIDPDSLYTFCYPTIEKPQFNSADGARKMFKDSGIKVEWIASSYIGGEGTESDTIKIAYDVEIFCGGNAADLEGTLQTKPIYSHRTSELEDSIPWKDIEKQVETGNYMVLRVNPVVVKGSSVAFGGEKKNIKDFALAELLSKKYFQCSNMIEISNTTPTTKTADALRGSTVAIGQYQLKIDEIKAGKGANTWSGKGHVLWQPMGMKVNVCVKFDTLRINTDDIVYGGLAYSYSNNESLSDIQVVDKLFSDWGIDNLIGDTGIPYASDLQNAATNGVKDIAKQLNMSKYYSYIKKGNALVDDFLAGEVKDLYMPVQLPESINKTPVDIQISSMKFAPTYATMDVIGEFTLPNSSYTKNNILIMGAPRLCISPDRVLPESGTIALLSNFTIKDPKSSYEMTFKAPKNVIEPDDGCYIAWHADALELLGVDIDMKIPGLVKDNNGTATKEKPTLNVRASIGNWDDWMVDNVTIDPFQAEKLPGWTFTASDIVYDHSYYRNSTKMGKFPTGYDKSKTGMTGKVTDEKGKTYAVKSNEDWQGLFIKKIGIKFPKSLEIGTKGDKRLEVSANNMFIDKSGASMAVTAANIISAKTGKAGGWDFSLNKVYLNFLQNNFNDCGFSGEFAVPLVSGQIAYDCKIKKLTSSTSTAGQYAYVFKTQQVKGLSLDFLLAKATFKKDQTYFLLESVPKSGGSQDTSVELMMGGDVTIGGADYINNTLKKKLKLNIEVPGVHFCGMRISNKSSSWKSTYESDMQKKAKDAKLSGKQFYAGKDLTFGSCYINFGKWSLASDQKKLGGFDLSLSKYEFSKSGSDLKLYMQGKISLVSGIDISATAGVNIFASVSSLSSLSDLKKIKLQYKKTEFSDLSLDMTFAGMGLKGTLKAGNDSSKEGYEGSLKFTMPGDLFAVNASGGYFKYQSGSTKYTYGWFHVKAGGNAGIDIPPVKITSITAGFYYNCKKDKESATPEKGLIGVIAGLELATTAGKEALSASAEMTVVYDSAKKRLSTFIFSGKVQAVSGLVSADCNLVYEHSNSAKYLQLDITVDASADCEKLANQMTGKTQSLSDLKTKLNSSYKKLKAKAPTGTLTAMTDNEGTPDKSKSGKSGSNLSASAGATINLQFKITWKEKSKTYDKPHWHLYIGEPEINKRCTYTWLKFKSKIVSVNFGANGYLCLGNELPNNGKLPEIPSQIRSFLNGGGDSKGIQSATLSEANRARESSLKDFEDQIATIGGGCMFGAQIYGYLDVDLGIFYLNAGATAGFDISIFKLPNNVYCTNFTGDPGYKRWYGYGQLYAYLYAKFGIKINLGFWKKDFDICDAGVGGLFQMQGPRPSHFEGQARVKLKLLSGLVNVDRKFAFECGQSCDLFYGNALDNFKLFGDLSCGYDNRDQGWSEKNAIDPQFLQRPYFTTEAPLNEPFRVLDETEKARLAKNYSGDKSDLDMEASRTFIFRSTVGSYVTLEETDSRGRTSKLSFRIKGQNRYQNYLDITQLNPNCRYKMTVTGYAKEIQRGKEVDPLKYNESSKKYYNEVWSQTKTYYFCTGPSKTIEDCPSNLSDYIAIAYPSYYNKIKDYGGYIIYAYINDIRYPNIAFYSDVSKKIFQKGTLKWKLLNSNGRLVSESTAKWAVQNSPKCCNLTSSSALSGVYNNTSYVLKLVYEVSKRTNGKPTVESTDVASMNITAYDGHWQTGAHYSKPLDYEKPFIGSRINQVNYAYNPNKITDYEFCRDNNYLDGRLYRVYDPYFYIGYLSNYAFLGGWEFSSDRIDVNITTSQSLIYTDKGGVYEGKLPTGQNTYNIYNDYTKIRDLSVYGYSQYGKFTDYPLPEIEDSKYSYTLTGLSRVPQYIPNKKNGRRVKGYIDDMYSPVAAAENMCSRIRSLIDTDFDDGVNLKNKGKEWTKDLNDIETWYGNHRGQMLTKTFNSATLQVPYYQFPIIYGSCLDNSGVRKKVTAWGTLKGYSDADKKNSHSRGHADNAFWVYCGLLGKDLLSRSDGTFSSKRNYAHSWDGFSSYAVKKHISSTKFDVYRVNAYDIDKCVYTINSMLYGENPFESFTLSYPLEYYNNYDK